MQRASAYGLSSIIGHLGIYRQSKNSVEREGWGNFSGPVNALCNSGAEETHKYEGKITTLVPYLLAHAI